MAGVADTLVEDDEVVDAFVDEPALALVLSLLVVDGFAVPAEALWIGLAAITPASPVNATPEAAKTTRRARAAGCGRREPGRPARGERRPAGLGAEDSLGALMGDSSGSSDTVHDPSPMQGVDHAGSRTW